MTDQEKVRVLTMIELAKGNPETQQQCCDLAARVSVSIGNATPQTDLEFRYAAQGAAKGLFGPAFENADEWQKSLWINMCEAALRKAVSNSMEAA